MGDYTLADEAEHDIAGIIRYSVQQFGPAQAKRYFDGLDGAARLVADFPAIGRRHVTASGRDYRIYHFGSHAIFYELEDGGVVVSRVLHIAMDYGRHLK
jgi:toxin ParE1/3/4